jgi:DNA-binding NtrC family response regulator
VPVKAAPRFWTPGPVSQPVAAYARSILVRTVESGAHDEVWPLLSMLYSLDEVAPPDFDAARARAEAEPGRAFRHYTDWARRQAGGSEHMELAVVSPDEARMSEWLRQRVRRRREYDAIFAADLETLLVLAQAADIALAAAATRIRRPKELQLAVLLLGESGTGKELLAKAMHQIHMRALVAAQRKVVSPGDLFEDTFGPINCGGLPASLIEAELFGHKKDSFTGAESRRLGIIPRHSNGTVFLDEIGDTPHEVQVRLLRFLNDGEVRPIGGDEPDHHYPWVIAATHRDLTASVTEGKFREDLFNRLNGHVLHLKPLNQRGDDAMGAFQACIKRHAGYDDLEIELSIPAARALRSFQWKGNLRVVDQFARRLVQERQPNARHLAVDLSHLPVEVVMQYLETRSYAEVLADQYAHEIQMLGEGERIAMRESLLRHYEGVLDEAVGAVRFVRTVARLSSSGVIERLFDQPSEHRRIVRSLEALAERTARHHQSKFRGLLYAVEGLDAPPEEVGTEVVENLPPRWRKALAVIEELAGNPEVATRLKDFESLLVLVPAPIREVVTDLLHKLADDVRTAEVDIGDEDVEDAPTAHWKDIRHDEARFKQELAKAGGSFAEMARRYRVHESTVSKAARAFDPPGRGREKPAENSSPTRGAGRRRSSRSS